MFGAVSDRVASESTLGLFGSFVELSELDGLLLVRPLRRSEEGLLSAMITLLS
jgi:hypothetical protein